MEKMQLFFNEVEFNYSMRQLNTAKSVCQHVVAQINEICSFKLDNTAFQDILTRNGDATAKRLEKAVEDELAQAKIVSSSIRNAAVTADSEKYYSILKAFVRPDNILWSYLSVNSEGNVIVSAEVEAILREKHTEYIKTQAGLASYAAHKKMVKAINEFLAVSPMIKPNGLSSVLGEGETLRSVGLPSGARLISYDRIAKVDW